MSAQIIDLAATRRARLRASGDLADILDSMLASCEAIQAALARQEADREERWARESVRSRTHRRQLDALLATYATTPLHGSTRAALANRGLALDRALAMSDEELSFLSPPSLAKLRALDAGGVPA